MPMVKVLISKPAGDRTALAKAVTAAAVQATGKAERYMQVILEENAHIMFAGDDSEPSAMLEVRALGGLGHPVCVEFSKLVCRVLREQLGIAPERVYINYMEFTPDKWGWNSTTF